MTKLKLMKMYERLKENYEELKEVNANLKNSLDLMKQDPGYGMQTELLNLRKQTSADAFLIDEYRKADDENKQFIELQKNHIDSLSLLIGVIIEKAADGSVSFVKLDGEQFVKLSKNELTESQGRYCVMFKEDEDNNLYIKTTV